MGEVMEGTPQGTMGELGGVKYYLAGIATGDAGRATTSTQVTDETTGPTESATKAIILCYDIFGLSVKNPKLIADALAKATSLPVYVPDYLEGDYVDPAKLHLDETLQSERPRFQKITTVVKMLVSFLVTTGPTFIYRHRAAVTVPIVEKVRINSSFVLFASANSGSSVLYRSPSRERYQSTWSGRILPRRRRHDQTLHLR